MMKNSLFFILLSISIHLVASYDEFVDSRGQCWRCYPNKPCERCPNFENHPWPNGWSDMCFEPNCNIVENRKFLFPSRESDRYFRCKKDRNTWTYETVFCPCGTLFNMRSQKCETVKKWKPYCVELITPVLMKSCSTGQRVPIDDGDGDVTIWEPTTTEISTTTTNNNCRCIAWMPCPCNPCWMMPCRNCNGCFG